MLDQGLVDRSSRANTSAQGFLASSENNSQFEFFWGDLF
jgi:hypothetical protein